MIFQRKLRVGKVSYQDGEFSLYDDDGNRVIIRCATEYLCGLVDVMRQNKGVDVAIEIRGIGE